LWTPLSDPIPGNPVNLGQTFLISFHPPEPCFGLTSCSIGFSFEGTAGGLPAFAFATFGDAPNLIPPGPPIIPITNNFEPPNPCFQDAACNATGPIVGYDAPLQIGTWDATISTTTPLPAALPLFATGLGALGLLGRRRKRRAQAVA
jgi:hypothetical protein